MDSMLTKKLLWLATGALLGGLTGYVVGELVAYKVLKDEEERQAGLEALNERASDYKSEDDLPEFTVNGQDPAVITYDEDKPKKNGKPTIKVDYTKYGRTGEKPPLSEVVSSIGEEHIPSMLDTPEVESVTPYVISEESYSDYPGYDKETITFYENDSTYCDSQEQIIDDPVKLLGPNVHLRFGEESNDPDIVYIRNDAIASDFEVSRVRKSYKTTVAGDIEAPVKPTRRERRGGRAVKKNDPDEEE